MPGGAPSVIVAYAVAAAQVVVSEGSLDIPPLAPARSLLGLAALCLTAWVVGGRRSNVPWRVVRRSRG